MKTKRFVLGGSIVVCLILAATMLAPVTATPPAQFHSVAVVAAPVDNANSVHVMFQAEPSPTQEGAIAPNPTDEPTAVPTAEATTEPGGTVIINNPPDNGANSEVAVSAISLLYNILVIALGGGSLLAIIFKFLSDARARDNAEKLYQAQSPDAQAAERKAYEMIRDLTMRVLDFADKVTDGKPNIDPGTADIIQRASAQLKQFPPPDDPNKRS